MNKLLYFPLLFLGFSFLIQKNPVTVFMIGDSTMADKPVEDNPERGWGQAFPQFFDSTKVRISNHAKNGRSTKSFIDEGLWEAVQSQIKKGDYVIMQFAHNDSKKEDPSRFAEANTTYKKNLRKFIQETRAKGGKPILVTPVMRRRFDEQGKFYDTHGDYPKAVFDVSKELKVPIIDLHQSSRKLIEKMGEEESKKLFLFYKGGVYKRFPDGVEDNTHFSEYGSVKIAELVATELAERKIKLAKFLKKK